jgi:hypothetical protein
MTNILTIKYKLNKQLQNGEISFADYHKQLLPLYEKN